MTDSAGEITQLLQRWTEGDETAFGRLMPQVYAPLRRLGARLRRGSDRDPTLPPTAVLHEAYFLLRDQRRVRWRDRGHFYAVAGTLMRRVLLRHAEQSRAAKRGSGRRPLPLAEAPAPAGLPTAELLALDQALERLAALDARQARVVELRFFGGLRVEEVAQALGVSPITVKRDWRMARAWLQRELRSTAAEATAEFAR